MNAMDMIAQARPASLDRQPAPERRAINLAAAIATPRSEQPPSGQLRSRETSDRLRRLAWPSRASHRIALGAGVAALVGGAAAAITLAYAGAPVTAAHQSQSALGSPAALRSAMLTAFDGVSGDIFYTRGAQGPGIPVVYSLSYPAVPDKGQLVRQRQYTVPVSDGASTDWEQIFRQDVNPRQPDGSVKISTQRMEVIDVEYGNHTWSKTIQSGGTFTTNGPAALRQEIANGKLGSIEKTELDGRPVFKVTIRDKSQGTVTTVWVDPTTYLPMQTESTGGGNHLTIESEYLPPTPANLAKLNVTIPAGFKQTPTMESPSS
jgi:hypothetical protein